LENNEALKTQTMKSVSEMGGWSDFCYGFKSRHQNSIGNLMAHGGGGLRAMASSEQEHCIAERRSKPCVALVNCRSMGSERRFSHAFAV
jgi:hypothetical protein